MLLLLGGAALFFYAQGVWKKEPFDPAKPINTTFRLVSGRPIYSEKRWKKTIQILRPGYYQLIKIRSKKYYCKAEESVLIRIGQEKKTISDSDIIETPFYVEEPGPIDFLMTEPNCKIGLRFKEITNQEPTFIALLLEPGKEDRYVYKGKAKTHLRIVTEQKETKSFWVDIYKGKSKQKSILLPRSKDWEGWSETFCGGDIHMYWQEVDNAKNCQIMFCFFRDGYNLRFRGGDTFHVLRIPTQGVDEVLSIKSRNYYGMHHDHEEKERKITTAPYLRAGEIYETGIWLDKGDEVWAEQGKFSLTTGTGKWRPLEKGRFSSSGLVCKRAGDLRVKALKNARLIKIVVQRNKKDKFTLGPQEEKVVSAFAGDEVEICSDRAYYVQGWLVDQRGCRQVTLDEGGLSLKGTLRPVSITVEWKKRKGI